MGLQIEMEHARKALIVRLKGELDHHTAEFVKARMEEAIEKRGTQQHCPQHEGPLFYGQLRIGSHSGKVQANQPKKGGKMVVCDVHPSVYRLFEMSGMFKILSIQENERSAVSSLEVVS